MFVDQFLVGAGMPLSVKDAATRYGRALADPGEPILKMSADAAFNPKGDPLELEDQFAPKGNRKNNPNLLDR